MTATRFPLLIGVVALMVVGCSRRSSREPGSTPQVTGATTSVTPDANQGGPLTIDELLRGRVSGLQIIPRPDGGYSYNIRGVSGRVEPLFLVDGVEIEANQLHTALSGLTREDIRKVEVLKDLASTAMYGQRGAGGVVLISTKKR
jgi:TonB-dependent SusC/RagA subfamily outer membrane receptor